MNMHYIDYNILKNNPSYSKQHIVTCPNLDISERKSINLMQRPKKIKTAPREPSKLTFRDFLGAQFPKSRSIRTVIAIY